MMTIVDYSNRVGGEINETNNRVDAVYNVLRGHVYGIYDYGYDAYRVDVPSGSVSARVNKIVGESVVSKNLLPNTL